MTIQYLKNYTEPHYELNTTDLDFTLNETQTRVKSRLVFNNYNCSKPLVLNGEHMTLISLKMDRKPVSKNDYALTDTTLTLNPDIPHFTLEIEVEINPAANTRLMGLYVSNGIFCTQCEPEGFRSITYYPDHSDVTSKWTVTLHADRATYPILLSNGNKTVDDGDTVVFEDPFKKPCYLFALVAGKLDRLTDEYTTGSGKQVELNLYSEKGRGDRLSFAMEALKTAMAWDEKVFGLEYDLNVFNIVAVAHFNAGAMENKSLNIFNDAALLASPDTATDAVYAYIEHVVAHEYFHNYSGDRVTLKNWFNLSLKEGFTVFRDQEFGYDVRSRAVGRIDDVQSLRAFQFPEDDGPLAHPVLPKSFKSINNFYTMTIYEKGAELIRMQKELLGDTVFFDACRLYFNRYDGQAVTINEFVKAMEDASGKDLTAFKQWYDIPGRPTVTVTTDYTSNTFRVTLTQTHKTAENPFVIPLRYGLVAADGSDMKTGTLVLDKKQATFEFKDLPEKPVLSINRSFSAPVDIHIDYTPQERLHLIRFDRDLFNRYEVGHQYALNSLLTLINKKSTTPDTDLIDALGIYFKQPDLDPAFLARAIILPSETELFDQLTDTDLTTVYQTRSMVRKAFADTYQTELKHLYDTHHKIDPYSPDATASAHRAVALTALGYLALTSDADLVMKHFESANNLTDRLGALTILVNQNLPTAQQALDAFYKMYQDDSLVLDKWLAVQARKPVPATLETVKELLSHPAFDYKNPNKVRALIGAFGGNLIAFYQPDNAACHFFVEQVKRIDALNPSIAARLLSIFAKYKKLPVQQANDVRDILSNLLKTQSLSTQATETLERML